jgi:hypothetical protein
MKLSYKSADRCITPPAAWQHGASTSSISGKMGGVPNGSVCSGEAGGKIDLRVDKKDGDHGDFKKEIIKGSADELEKVEGHKISKETLDRGEVHGGKVGGHVQKEGKAVAKEGEVTVSFKKSADCCITAPAGSHGASTSSISGKMGGVPDGSVCSGEAGGKIDLRVDKKDGDHGDFKKEIIKGLADELEKVEGDKISKKTLDRGEVHGGKVGGHHVQGIKEGGAVTKEGGLSAKPTTAHCRSPFARTAMSVMALFFVLVAMIPGQAGAILSNPLKKPCLWEWDRDIYTPVQKNCVKDVMGGEAAENFVEYTRSEGWEFFFNFISVNPLGVPKLDFVTFFKVAAARLCGGDIKSIGATQFGLKLAYDLIARGLNPLYLIPKALSHAPKIGPFFKKVADFFEKPSKRMDEISKELDEKCDAMDKDLKVALQVLAVFGKIQLALMIVDQAIFPPIVTGVCASTNAKAILLLMEGGTCGKNTAGRSLLSASNRYLASGECSVAGALEPITTVIDALIANTEAVDAAIDTASEVVSPLIPPFQASVEALGVIKDAFDPILDLFSPYEGLFDSLYSVFKYIQCPEWLLGPICSIQDILAEGVDKVLDALGIPNLGDLVEELLGAVSIPDLDVDLPFDLNFKTPFATFLIDLQEQVDKFLAIDRDLFDPFVKLEAALNSCGNGGGMDWTVHITTSSDGLVDFACPTSDSRPVVYKAEFSRWSCTQDMTGIYRFPCGNDKSSCSNVNFRQFSRCADPAPEVSLSYFSS